MSTPTDHVVRRGTVRKCPSCGAQVTAVATACDACGHEFTDIEANRSVAALAEQFEALEQEASAKGLVARAREREVLTRKSRVIRDFPVPNAREDLQELLRFIHPKIVPSLKPDPNVEDWRAKFTEVLGRARAAYKGDSSALAEFDRLEQSLQTTIGSDLKITARRNPLFVALLAGVVLAGGAWAASVQMERSELRACQEAFTRSAATEKARLEGLYAATGEQLKARKFTEALATAATIRWEIPDGACMAGENQSVKADWDHKRTEIAALVQGGLDAATTEARAEAERQLAEKQAERDAEAQKLAERARAEAAAEAQREAAERQRAAKAATEARRDKADKLW